MERREVARTRNTPPEDLVSQAEIAERLGVSLKTIHKWRERYPHFPEPYVILAIGPIWQWVEVETWHRTKGPRPYNVSD
jgi:predicted DNA-binding transcriptional regulator AlpA